MGITFGDHLIDSGYYDITPAQEREIEAREECKRRGLNPDDYAADDVTVWMVVDKELFERMPFPEPGDTEVVWDGMSRSIQRMRSIVEIDGPPSLLIGELDLMESRLAALRRSRTKAP